MPRSNARFFACAILLTLSAAAHDLSAQGTLADYNRAAQFTGARAARLVYRASVTPNWIARTDRFWYRNDLPSGREFILVDPEQKSRRPAFDHARLATALSAASGMQMRGDSLPFDRITLSRDLDSLAVNLRRDRFTCSLVSYDCARDQSEREDDDAGDRRTRSPDGKWQAFVRDHDLWVRSTATGAETRLTTDGEKDWAYATPIPNPRLMFAQNRAEPEQPAAVFWSPDSRKLLTYRMDTRAAGRLTMIENAPKDAIRPRSFSYVYQLAVDSVLPTAELVLFDAESWKQIPIKAPAVEQYYYGGPFFSWMPDSRRIQFSTIDRGYTVARWYELDTESGTTRTMLQQQDTPYYDWYGRIAYTLHGGHEALIGSEQDGWMHLYLYDLRTGALEKRLTSGEWVVDDIQHVDEDARVVFFTSGGREAGRDPYLRHLYRVGLDGRGFRLLTPENADHSVSFSPGGKYFVDNYSRVDLAPVSVLRSSANGDVVVELEHADISRLLATGWTPPVPFKAKARDGKTDIYGLMWRPTNFDSTRKYPVVEQVYTGPHGFFVPKTFNAYRSTTQAISELGFITVMVDGLGTAKRSREFHLASYQNLGEGAADHPGAIRQLASRYSYIDTTRVGIYGHSAGGYDAAHAILAYPDFYKVAVSSAGNHDNRMDKAVWNTQWMGWPVTRVYEEQSNITLAPNLEGKLFLMHGDVDDNVPISETLQLAAALIKANKDFDLLIMPGETHGSGGDPYFIRRRWDYFVRNLLGVEPPDQFDISAAPATVSSAR